MTERLYYHDAHLRSFDATVTDISADGHRVYLDRTAFYPTSGGQPHDRGSLGGMAITDVIDEDDRIAHVVESTASFSSGQRVLGEIDWERRLDFMQQHTGQHLLSAICADRYQWPTVSVHFGDEYATLDIAAESVTPEAIADVERLANIAVFENVRVSVTFEEASTATGLRKPTGRTGEIRIIEITGYDRSACGGTHVSTSGAIGGILLRRVEKVKQGTRIEFVCGVRAAGRARADYAALSQASQALSVTLDEVPLALASAMRRARQAESASEKLERELDVFRARELWSATAPDANGRRIVMLESKSGGVNALKSLAQAIASQPGGVAIVSGHEPSSVLLACADDSGVNAGALLKQLLPQFGGRGGGSPRMAQGTVPEEQLAQLLELLWKSI